MRVNVLGAEHPDEEEATEIVRSLIDDPIPNVKGTLVNLLGLKRGVRVVDVNMVLAYPGNPNSVNYEERRAAEILKDIRADDPDVVISLHNPGDGNTRYAVIDPRMGVTPETMGMLRELGISHMLTANFGIMAHCPNAVLIEIPKEDIRTGGAGLMRRFFDTFANHPHPPTARPKDFKWYTHREVNHGGLHRSEISPTDLSEADWSSIREFGEAPPIIQEQLGRGATLYMTSTSREVNENGYWAELVLKVNTPDSSHWPS